MPRPSPQARRGSSRAAGSAGDLLHPLNVTYALSGGQAPSARAVAPERVPAPYRGLLVHDRDMTPTLEWHFGGRLVVRPLSVHERGRWYVRRVLLVLEDSGRPVAMGAVRMRLDGLGNRVRNSIRRGRVPLGRILRDSGLGYRSRPRRFLAVTPNPEMMGAFWMHEAQRLYGRQTDVMLGGAKVGDIVEVLPLV